MQWGFEAEIQSTRTQQPALPKNNENCLGSMCDYFKQKNTLTVRDFNFWDWKAPAVFIHLLGTPHFQVLCFPKGWLFTASCLGVPPRAQRAFQSPSQSVPATWTRCIPQQHYYTS